MDDAQHNSTPRHKWRERLFSKWGFVLLVLLLAFAAAPWLIGPQLPKRVVIATGREDGVYVQFAEKYKEVFARDGIELEIRKTAGSVENVRLVQNGEADFAFMQGGVADKESASNLQSLCSLYPEPVWVFHRTWLAGDRRGDPVDLRNAISTVRPGLRIAVGGEGSGTRFVAMQLLEKSGVLPSQKANTTLFPLGGRQAAEALKRGEIDIAFLSSPRIRPLCVNFCRPSRFS